MPPPLTPRQRAILAAVEAGHTTTRAIMAAACVSSTSVVQYNLLALAARDLIVLEEHGVTLRVYSGRDYCQAWDAAARLSGNPEA
jgi:hypothetical protein